MKLKHDYDGLLELLDSRRGQAEKFLAFIEKKTNWLTCPASTRHHLNVPGGLIQHSLMVTRTLLDVRDTLSPDYSDEACVMVGLFHDVGKVGAPGKPYYQVVRGTNGELGYKVNDDLVAMGMAVRSLYLIAPYVKLTDEEAQAICYHDGQYVPDNLVVKNRECPLTHMLHFADLWSSHQKEEVEDLDNVRLLLEKLQ
jgi:hypothetical protein